MKKLIVFISLCFSTLTYANDSTGYVGTGGIEYLKNKNIAMQSEDLFISKKIIKVDYQFKNLGSQDITETVLFPLPKLDNFFEADFAHTEDLLKSFVIQVNGQKVRPEMHVRTFIRKDEKGKDIDVTNEFISCGFSQKEMLNPWNRENTEYFDFQDKLRRCKNAKIQQLLPKSENEVLWWSAQVIYSWKQTFKANSVTQVKHQYKPLVGGSVALYEDEYNQ